MTHDDPIDPVEISRRTLLGIALGTMPAAALAGGPLAALWPARSSSRETHEPYLLCLEGRLVWDPSAEVYRVLPTLREVLEASYDRAFGCAEGEELKRLIADMVSYNEGLSPSEDAEAFRDRVAEIEDALDEEVKLDEWIDQHLDWLDHAANRTLHETWDRFPDERLEAAGLRFVEGGHPMSTFSGICYDGTVEELNHALAREGLNIVVEERAVPCLA